MPRTLSFLLAAFMFEQLKDLSPLGQPDVSLGSPLPRRTQKIARGTEFGTEGLGEFIVGLWKDHARVINDEAIAQT